MLSISVIDMDSASSPLAMSVNRLESMPPGVVASSTKPTASAGVGATVSARVRPIAGGTISIEQTPKISARLLRNTWRKSSAVSDSPIESMIATSEPGSTQLPRKDIRSA
jgi:hypothetical protein